MATYAIGDLQGCYTPFLKLLDLIRFDPARDRLWLVGDIVNRGPDSLSLLRFIKQMGSVVTLVLGNHDLHLLMIAAGIARLQRSDTLQSVLNAPDCEELLLWLRHQKLFHVEGEYAMVHAGLLPSWTIKQAAQLAQEAERGLQSEHYKLSFEHIYGNEPDYWHDDWDQTRRLRVVINAMTRMRICTLNGQMNLAFKGNLHSIPAGYLPWFDIPRHSQNTTIICGHWSALGLHVTANLIALDSGCVWGRQLTAIRLEDRKVFQFSCAE